MEIKEVKSEGLSREYNVTISNADFNNEVQNKLKEIGKTVSMAGFRAGKVPFAMVKKKYQANAMSEALDDLLRDGVNEVLKEKDLRPVFTPDVDLKKFEEGKDIEFTVSMDIMPTIEVKDLSKVEVEKLVAEVPSEEIEKAINYMAESHRDSAKVEEDRETKKGDIAVIDFVGSIDGVEFPGGKGEAYPLELGSNSFIQGFEEQLIGTKAGSEVDVNVTFPENYHAENLKGKPAVFKCKVHEVKTKVIPSLDDTFAQKQGFNTVDELREAMRVQMNQRNQAKAYNKYFEDVCSYLVSNSELEVNDEQIEVSMKNVLAYYEQSVSQYGINLEQFLQMTGKTLEEFKETLKPEAIRGAKINMILEHIAHEENIVVTEEEIEIELKRIAQYYSLNEEQMKQFKNANLAEFENEILKQKVFKFVVTNL